MSTPKIQVVGYGYSKTETDELLKSKTDLEVSNIHEKRISNLEQQLSPSYIETDDSITASKMVPANACSYAEVNKIGGMSYKSRNLIRFPYYNTYREYMGVTWTVNDDGSVTGTGTADQGHYPDFKLCYKGWILPEGKYTLSGIPGGFGQSVYIRMCFVREDGTNAKIVDCFSSDTAKTFTVDFEYAYIDLYIRQALNTTLNNVTFYPMLNEGDTALPYELFDGLRETKVEELRSKGANLADVGYTTADWVFMNGHGNIISIAENSIEGRGAKGAEPYTTYNTNGWLTCPQGRLKLKPLKKGDLISLSYDFEILELPSDYTNSTIKVACGFSFIENANVLLWAKPEINFALGVQRVKSTFEITEAEANLTPNVRIAFNSLHARVSNIMINYGEVAPYKPYRSEAVDTFQISEELRAFLEPYGYGLGVNSEFYNYIDFERKVFVQNVARKIFDGGEAIAAGTTSVGYVCFSYRLPYPALDREEAINLVSNHYKLSTSSKYINSAGNDEENLISANGYYLSWFDREVSGGECPDIDGEDFYEIINTMASEMTAKLKDLHDAKNPLMVDYILATPNEIDISTYLSDDNFIEVEGGGLIIPVSDYEYPAPTEITYMLKEGEAT